MMLLLWKLLAKIRNFLHGGANCCGP